MDPETCLRQSLKPGPLAITASEGAWPSQGSSSGDPLSVINWLNVLKETNSLYVPGIMIAWELMVGNSNTRWHWGSRPGTPEPAIPWCGMLW